jgi:hypothetical protein
LVGAAVLLLLLAVAGNLGDRSREDPGPARLGDPVRDGQFEFVVAAVDCGARRLPAPGGERPALGQFCLVRLAVRNVGGEGRTLEAARRYLLAPGGRKASADLGVTLALSGPRLLSTLVNPGNRVQGTLVYDVPRGAAPTGMELHNSPFSRGVRVRLR